MLLAIEVSLYCPRFVVMDVKDNQPRLVFTAVVDHQREASMAQQNRTSTARLLLEIAEKLGFILTAYPVTHAVWHMRQLGIVNMDAAKTALGAILLTLAQHGVDAAEMQRSRVCLLLTGSSKPDAHRLQSVQAQMLPSAPSAYATLCSVGLAWMIAQHLLHRSLPLERRDVHTETAGVS